MKVFIYVQLNPQIYFDYAYIWPEGRELSALAQEFILELRKVANTLNNQ